MTWWRTLRFMLLLSPRWTLAIPGYAWLGMGLTISTLVAAKPFFFSSGFGVDVSQPGAGLHDDPGGLHGVHHRRRGPHLRHPTGDRPPSPYAQRVLGLFTLERGVIVGCLMLLLGLVLVGRLAWLAVTVHLQPDQVRQTMRARW
jgi:hypothetical protein